MVNFAIREIQKCSAECFRQNEKKNGYILSLHPSVIHENLSIRLKSFYFKLLVIYGRYPIGFAFVFASVVEIKSMRFISIPPTEPVGYFFEAVYYMGSDYYIVDI